ncbi:flotillin [Microterricola gilva]|uniref:Flotillin n=1 Tax=Microterricola gilva TaxID=393267 RepID=A0A4Q8AQX2_9MICO|nr:SPFH domain-containing protein [Microterricola gilva]RZU67028.1 flotillin [Microterricola gilva]
MFDFWFGPIPAIIGAVVIVLIIALIYSKTLYKNAGPDEALIITGKRSKRTVVDGQARETSGQRIVVGQGVFITPFFQKVHKLELRSRAIEVTALAQDRNGVTITVDAVAIVKVGEEHASILAAAQRFLGQDKNIDSFAQEVLSGSLRASIGATDVMTIIQRRDELGATVLSTARESLANQGLDVDSFEIKGITDDNNYINDIGRAEQAKVRAAAEVAEAASTREARQAAIAAEQAVAEAEATLALRRAALKLDTDRAAAESEAARPLAEATAQQNIIEQQELTAQKRAQLKKAELESEVNAVADAESYRIRVTAEAQAAAAVAAANSSRDSRVAAAEAVRVEGEAEAGSILARGKAEAEATRLSAQAVAEQSDALIQLRMIESLPLIAHEIAAPMGNIDQLTVISTDGASQLSKNVASGFSEVDSVLKSTMGVGVRELLNSVVGGAAGGAVGGAVAGRDRAGAGTDSGSAGSRSGAGKKAASAGAASAPELVAAPKVVAAPAAAAPVAAPVASPVAPAAPAVAPVAPPVERAAAASGPVDPVVAQAIAAAETAAAQQVQATGAVPAPNRATLDAFAAEHGIDPELASQILTRVSAKFKAGRAK